VGLIVAILVFLPALAHACPACLGSQTTFTSTMKLLGIFILFPFLVGALVLRAIRNAQREMEDPRARTPRNPR
jgi:hypothetical protein